MMAANAQPASADAPPILGGEIMRRLDLLAECSLPGPGVTRLPFTAEHRGALELLTQWMRDAGLAVHLDAAGTLIGRRDGIKTHRTLLLGSHQDSIPQGGRYDGILGVVLPIVCLMRLKDAPLDYSVEVLAFADEEGVRFPTALLGPRALTGAFDPVALDWEDKSGVSMRAAMRAYGLRPDDIAELARPPEDVLGYVETHIEQGPVLESRGLPLGVVTAICGIERWKVTLRGRAAHAGTTPMDLRLDALAGAADIISALERSCRETEGVVGNVGELTVTPNAVNVVPAQVDLSLELRAADDGIRRDTGAALADCARHIAKERGLDIALRQTYVQDAVRCDAALTSALEEAVKASGSPPFRLQSGATHDASAMASSFPVAMLFVRCLGGVSHHPEESITTADATAAAAALSAFLLRYQVSPDGGV